VAKDFHFVLCINFLGKLLPNITIFQWFIYFAVFARAKLGRIFRKELKILLTNALIFGTKNACIKNKEKESWDSLSNNRILFRRMIWL